MPRDEKCLQNSYDLDVETYVQPNCRITRSCDLECTLWSDLDTNGSRGLAVPRIWKLCSTGRDERRESRANARTAVHAKTVRSTKTLRRKTSSLTQAANFSVLTASRSAVWQRQGEMESTEQARSSSTSGGLPRPEPGYCQPTPPYKTAAQGS